MNYRTLAIGDLHFKLSNLSDQIELERRICEEVDRHKPDVLILMGDSLDSHETVYTPCLNAFQAMVMRLSKRIKVIILIGNHDYINNQCFLTKEHPFNSMKLWPNVQIIDRPTIIAPGIAACPYVPNGRFREALDTLDSWQELRAIFCHQEIRGAKLGPIESQTGDEWDARLPFLISGHIHERQYIEDSIGQHTLYIGIPMDTAFDKNPERSISLFEFDDSSFREEIIHLDLPRKLTFDLRIENTKTFVPPSNTHVRIHLFGTSAEINAFRKTKAGQTFYKTYKVIPKPEDDQTIRSGLERKSYLSLLKETVDKEDELVKMAFEEVTQNANNA